MSSLDLVSTSALPPVEYVVHPRARRYRLIVRRDGTARVTIPRRGSRREAEQFVARHADWLRAQLARAPVPALKPLRAGERIWFRGERVEVQAGAKEAMELPANAGETLRVSCDGEDFRPSLARALRQLAEEELPGLVRTLAAQEQLTVTRITIRNQRTRWGSASRRGTISLNWRLVQVPPAVRDYVIWHELMHLREMNHSSRFWAQVARVCPDFEQCRRWLLKHGRELGV